MIFATCKFCSSPGDLWGKSFCAVDRR